MCYTSAQVTCEDNQMSYSEIQQISKALNFCFYISYCNLKEKERIKRNINSKKKHVYIANQYYYYFRLPRIRVGIRVGTTKN